MNARTMNVREDTASLSWEVSDETLESESGLALGNPSMQHLCPSTVPPVCSIWEQERASIRSKL